MSVAQETEYESGFGIFEDHDQVRTMRHLSVRSSEDGLVVNRSCEKCAVEVTAVIPWEEVYCVSKGHLPQAVHPKYQSSQWVYDAQRATMYPKLICSSCGYLVAFPLTPNDAEQRLRSAHSGNIMSASQRQACGMLAQAFQKRAAAAAAPQPRRR